MNLNLFTFATFSMIIIFMCIIFIIRKSIFFNSQEKDLLQEVFYNSMELRLYIPLQAFSTLCTLCCWCMFVSILGRKSLEGPSLFMCLSTPSTVLCHKVDTQRMNGQQRKNITQNQYYPTSSYKTCPYSGIFLNSSDSQSINGNYVAYILKFYFVRNA